MIHIEEPGRCLPVRDRCDVLVAGGGFAGAAAALAAARCGRDVILAEREFMLGGLGTAGLITIYLPLCDGRGRQVSFGLAEELLRLVLRHGLEDRYPRAWLENGTAEERRTGQRFMAQYNAQICALELENLLREAGVRILYGTSVCSLRLDVDRVDMAVVENKSGRSAIALGRVIDCTGDADLCWMAGLPTVVYPEKNSPAAWYYYLERGRLCLNQLGACDHNDENPDTDYQYLDGLRITGTDAWELSRFVQDNHRALLADVVKRRAAGGECVPVTMAAIPQVRMTRRLEGAGCVREEQMGKELADSVGMFADWTARGPVYELPFTALYHPKVRNLAAAGRCISATDRMWNLTRVIPACAVSGQAAGVAAAITDDFSVLPPAVLQQQLRAQGVRIHLSELQPDI